MGRMELNIQHAMGCEVCGNDCSDCFEVHLGGERHVFDCFECAMRAFLPRCQYCSGQIIGRGVLLRDELFCGYQCADEKYGREFETRVQLDESANVPSNSHLS